MRNRRIKRTNKIKFLGVMLDSSLSFGYHISYITGKISRSVGMVARVSHMIPFPQLLNIYYSIIYSHLSYCVPVWGKASTTVELRMQRMQRSALRVITRHAANTQPQIRKILTFNSIYKYFTSVKLFSVLKEGKHEYFRNRVESFQVDHRHSTRFKVNMCLTRPLFRKSKCQTSFIYRSIETWNELPLSIRACDAISEFKKLLKANLVNTQDTIQLF